MEDTIILGAGLTGLTIAYHLKKNHKTCKVLEAQDRLGGRIKTIQGANATPMEMGATWFGQEHTTLLTFLKEIDIAYFEQHTHGNALFETMSFEPPQQYFVPANTHSAYRVKGGTYSIIEKLYKEIGKDNVTLSTEIKEVIEEQDSLRLIDQSNKNYYCKKLIIAGPPQVVLSTIQFTPSLPSSLTDIMYNTQTWMSGSTKFAVEYKNAFWKEKGFSGTVFSQSNLATEIYDHSNAENNKFALKGFLNGTAAHYSLEERRQKVIVQLANYFGEEANNYLSYNDTIWNDRYIQGSHTHFLPPHFNNGHSLLQYGYLGDKLFFSGTETSKLYSGYMEGAIIAAHNMISKIN